jgi:hypothetical protein
MYLVVGKGVSEFKKGGNQGIWVSGSGYQDIRVSGSEYQVLRVE